MAGQEPAKAQAVLPGGGQPPREEGLGLQKKEQYDFYLMLDM